jgi:Domain of unknown function (DUF5010)
MRVVMGFAVFLAVTLAAVPSDETPVPTGTLPETPPGPHFPLTERAHAGAASFATGQPVIGTTYFYWYDSDSGAHVTGPGGRDELTTHPAEMSGLSYKRASWHEVQLRDMTAASLDFLMPVFWGVPGKYGGWSFAGLPPLVEAHDRLLGEGEHPPAIGMFFDTSILRVNAFNEDGSDYHVDLTTDFGKSWFYTAIRDFFSLIPPAKWARVDGRPIVFLYSASYARACDPEVFSYVRRRFKEDFATDLFLVKMRDWPGEADADATYQWTGGSGFQADPEVVAISPGYDHSAIQGREPLVVDRRDGRTYSERWLQALRFNTRRRPWMVHVETWNEWHEGTDIADSREYGRTYIALTRVFADLWRNGEVSVRGPYTGAQSVSWKPGQPEGLSLRVSSGDGEWDLVELGDRSAVVSCANAVESAGRFLYFEIDDSFAFDLAGLPMTVSVTYRDGGCGGFSIDYDNSDSGAGPVDGAFRPGGGVAVSGTGTWESAVFELPQCRFVNRCNAADFRLGVGGGDMELAVSEVTVSRGGRRTGGNDDR